MSMQEQMKAFYAMIADDARISVTHISLYMSLLQKWNGTPGEPLQLKRQEIMRDAKISARQTFNKCMHELSHYGYIKYYPSPGPFQRSCIYLLKL
jgi:hypothetical protein